MIVNPIIHNHTNLNIFEKVRVIDIKATCLVFTYDLNIPNEFHISIKNPCKIILYKKNLILK